MRCNTLRFSFILLKQENILCKYYSYLELWLRIAGFSVNWIFNPWGCFNLAMSEINNKPNGFG